MWDNLRSLKKPFWLTSPGIDGASTGAQIKSYACKHHLKDITFMPLGHLLPRASSHKHAQTVLQTYLQTNNPFPVQQTDR
jgi:hypothetical protein